MDVMRVKVSGSPMINCPWLVFPLGCLSSLAYGEMVKGMSYAQPSLVCSDKSPDRKSSHYHSKTIVAPIHLWLAIHIREVCILTNLAHLVAANVITVCVQHAVPNVLSEWLLYISEHRRA